MSKPVPQDHKQKEVKPKVTKTSREVGGREVDGFEVDHLGATVFVSREAFDDFEFLDDIAHLENQKAQRLPMLLRRMLDDKDFKAVMGALRDKTTGRVSISLGMKYVQEVLQAVNPNG